MSERQNPSYSWLIPKLLFFFTILFAIVWGFVEIIRKASGDASTPDPNYSALTFWMLTFWLGTSALELLIGKFENPMTALLRSFQEDLHRFLRAKTGTITMSRDFKKIFAQLREDISRSESTIDVVSWTSLGQPGKEDRGKEMLDAFVVRARARGSSVVIRRLLWRPEHLDFIERHKDLYNEFKDVEFAYLGETKNYIPMTPCVIIDKKIVHYGLGYLGNPEYDVVDVIISDENIVELYLSYFKYLWTHAEKIKEQSKTIDIDRLKNLKEQARQGNRAPKAPSGEPPMSPSPPVDQPGR